MTKQRSDPLKTVILLLEDMGPSTTKELQEEASIVSKECADRLPGSLLTLEKRGKIRKELSKEKKSIVWSLVN
ncbi:MAG: hypothetical protein ACTSP4_04260 [Candidatus Hodarchaeales archaeon]